MSNQIKVGDKVRVSKDAPKAEKTDTDNIVENISAVMEGYRKAFADIADSFDWVRYEADLAREIVLKLVGPNNDEQMLVGYAVNIAKSVVEELKKK